MVHIILYSNTYNILKNFCAVIKMFLDNFVQKFYLFSVLLKLGRVYLSVDLLTTATWNMSANSVLSPVVIGCDAATVKLE